MNRFNKGKSQKAGTFVITISVGSMALLKVDVAPKVFSRFSSHSAGYALRAESPEVVFGAAWSYFGRFVGG